jgi:hypothetical protein
MSILADSLGPSYSSGVSPSLHGDQNSMSALFAETSRQRRKGVPTHAEKKKNQPTIRRDEAPAPNIQMEGPFDALSGLVDFELFEQSVQSPDDDDSSRNSQAPADFDANALLSGYGSLFDAPQAFTATTPTSSTFPPIF